MRAYPEQYRKETIREARAYARDLLFIVYEISRKELKHVLNRYVLAELIQQLKGEDYENPDRRIKDNSREP